MAHTATIAGTSYVFADLKMLLAKATPHRAGDALAGVAAADATERVAAQFALADLPLGHFLNETVIPYEDDEVTLLIIDGHDRAAFAPVASLTVGEFRDWLLSDAADIEVLSRTVAAASVASFRRRSAFSGSTLGRRKPGSRPAPG